MNERLVRANGVDLCVQTFGSPADPTVLLVHGACASMLWWPDALCRLLAERGRHVVRFDSRDTGRSTHYPAGAPPYGLRDLADDAVGLLDALGIATAHVVGRSMGGGTAIVAALDHPERVATLTLVSTTNGDPDLPDMAPTMAAAFGNPPSGDPVADIVALIRAYAGTSPHFDEAAVRAVAAADVARTLDLEAAMTNHLVMAIDGPRSGGGPADVEVPTLVVHGALDPAHPLPHGRRLADTIPGARLLVLPDTGHDVPPAHYPTFVDALVDHTRRPR